MTISRNAPFQLLASLAALALVILPIAACGALSPPGPTTRFQSRCEIANAPAEVDAYQVVWKFDPGSWTSQHSHLGPVCASVLEGGITFRFANYEKKLGVGESFVEPVNEVHRAGNTTGSSSLLLGTNLTPRGKPQATVIDPAQTATRTTNSQFQVNQLPGQMKVTHTVLDFAPGAWTPAESHGGKTLNTVLSGTVTLRVNGTDKTFTAGQFWSNDAGQVYTVGNASSTTASVFESSLLSGGT